jgi:hypothetical protein
VAHEEAMQRADPDRSAALDQSGLDLDEGNVALLGNQFPDERALRLDPARMPIATSRLGDSLPMLERKLPPADRARYADTEPTSRSPAAQAAVNRSNNPIPKVL